MAGQRHDAVLDLDTDGCGATKAPRSSASTSLVWLSVLVMTVILVEGGSLCGNGL